MYLVLVTKRWHALRLVEAIEAVEFDGDWLPDEMFRNWGRLFQAIEVLTPEVLKREKAIVTWLLPCPGVVWNDIISFDPRDHTARARFWGWTYVTA